MIESLLFYLLFFLPAAMTLVALAVGWSSLSHPVLFGITAFLSLIGMRSVVNWAALRSLHNFIPADRIAPSRAGESSPFELPYYGTQLVVLIVAGSLLLRWLGGALAKA